MREMFHKILAIASLIGCGEKVDPSRLADFDINPANLPVRSDCLGLDATRNRNVSVDWDDHTPLRVCLVQQTDGALGFDIRLRTDTPGLRRQAMNVEVQGSSGRKSSGVYPLVWNPFNGIYELQLSQGCLVGAPGGCSVTAPDDMRQLFTALPPAEGNWHPDVTMSLSLVQPDGKAAPDNARFIFQWSSGAVDANKSVN
ncbi:MAG TPA: hypothetical protein VE954_04790 [Oligoflexus sp.]|uniref:hypothetical protein n=1 Tax=Oligoflexus sp. TaxID=1971216 RepID=UPI002D3A7F70|nr:hypothetical protein [Oligoflexus sp.]HYX32408.1 hypothetical protein [Oligoflexus sp.]